MKQINNFSNHRRFFKSTILLPKCNLKILGKFKTETVVVVVVVVNNF